MCKMSIFYTVIPRKCIGRASILGKSVKRLRCSNISCSFPGHCTQSCLKARRNQISQPLSTVGEKYVSNENSISFQSTTDYDITNFEKGFTSMESFLFFFFFFFNETIHFSVLCSMYFLILQKEILRYLSGKNDQFKKKRKFYAVSPCRFFAISGSCNKSCLLQIVFSTWLLLPLITSWVLYNWV